MGKWKDLDDLIAWLMPGLLGDIEKYPHHTSNILAWGAVWGIYYASGKGGAEQIYAAMGQPSGNLYNRRYIFDAHGHFLAPRVTRKKFLNAYTRRIFELGFIEEAMKLRNIKL